LVRPGAWDTRDSSRSVVTPVTVVVIDDHPVFRDGLVEAVASSAEFTVAGEFPDVESYERAGFHADVILLDYHLPGLMGPEAVSRLTASGAAVLMVSAEIGREAVIDTLAAGARGYVAKDAQASEILRALRVVSDPDRPGTYVSATLASYLLDAARSDRADRLTLSGREQEVLRLVAAGERDQDIAESLYISVGTVRSHLDRIRTKTGERRRADLTRYAMDHGLVRDKSSEAL
jgi:DNA-binding NarL/FixJ family response regulator